MRILALALAAFVIGPAHMAVDDVAMIAAYFAPTRAILRRIGRPGRKRARIITAAKSDNHATIAAALICLRFVERWSTLDPRRRADGTRKRAPHEALRLRAPVPALMRRTVKETRLLGVRIPADTGVMVGVQFSHMMEDYWTNPSVFDPERFGERAAAAVFDPPLCQMRTSGAAAAVSLALIEVDRACSATPAALTAWRTNSCCRSPGER